LGPTSTNYPVNKLVIDPTWFCIAEDLLHEPLNRKYVFSNSINNKY